MTAVELVVQSRMTISLILKFLRSFLASLRIW